MYDMYELVKAGNNSYYIYCPTNIGIYIRPNGKAVVIDTGNSSNTGKTISKILDQNQWDLDCIITTHGHADHFSGNQYLQDKYHCPIFANKIEGAIVQNPMLLSALIYGGNPAKEFVNRSTYGKPSVVSPLDDERFPKELEIIDLKGHAPDMIGIRTPDDVVYVGDAYVSETILDKYTISFIFNVEDYLDTLQRLMGMKAKMFVPAHDDPAKNISDTLQYNYDKAQEVIEQILFICENPCTFDELLEQLFQHFHVNLNYNQYFLLGTTIKGYLAYLQDCQLIVAECKEYKMVWKRKF